MKLRARTLITTTRPHPCLVTLAIIAFTWIINYLAQRIGGQPLLIDLDAVSALDYPNMIRFDISNISFIPTTLLIAFELVSVILSFGYTAYLLRVVRQEPSGFANLLDGFSVAGKAILLTVFVDALVAVASVLLLIPGIIVAYQYSMASFLLMDHPDWSVVQCMRESRRIMQGHKWELFVLQLSFFGWMLLTVIPGVAVFVRPYMSLTETVFYENLCAARPAPPYDF